MMTQEQIKDRDEKQDQLSPQNKEDLDEITARYHSDESQVVCPVEGSTICLFL